MSVTLEKIKAYKNMPNVRSSDIIWINWYEDLEKRYGTKDAARIFLPVWSKQGTSIANTYALRERLRKDGIQLEQNVITKLEDFGGGFNDFLTGVTKAGKVATYAVGGVLILGLGLFVYNVASTPDKILDKIKK